MPYADPDDNRDAAAERSREKTRAAQEISARLWPVENPRRRAKALKSYRFFAQTYFPERFTSPWSDDHLKVIALIEQAVLTGGKITVAMPRGSGKTTLIEVACIWAILIGARAFVALIGSDRQAALEMLESIKAELATNELLAADFPREVGPFVLLEGESRRCTGQRFEGERTYIRWNIDCITFATLPESKASGGIIKVAGLTGRIRGMKFTRPDGRVVRPDLCVPDDPQTDESAGSASQTEARERIINSTIRGLAGPGRRIAILMPVTVIRRGDLAERMFDRKRHPDWEGLRLKALYSFPTNMALWEKYAEIFRDAAERGADRSEATKFYRANRAAMDAGAKVAWVSRFEKPDELSAIQNAMNLFLFSREAFFSEHQNEPEEEELRTGKILADQVLGKLNQRKRGEVPAECRWLTCHVDIHDEIFYWHVLAIAAGFTAYTIDYGTWPGQPDRYFAQDNPRLPLSKVYPNRSKEGVICAGLEDLLGRRPDGLLSRRYAREGGGDVPIDQVGVDAGYKPDEVAKILRSLAQGNRLVPTKGIGFGPNKKPFPEYRPEKGVILGRHWRKCVTKATSMLTLEIDTNRWKTFVRDRVIAPKNDPASWSLFGRDPREHQLFADHQAAEIPTPVSGPYGEMEMWAPPPSKPDNHWWDNLVSCCVLANALPGGPKLPEWERGTKASKPAKEPRKAVGYL